MGRYRITSNRESGYGRYDVMLEPTNSDDPAFILEFKIHERNEESLQATVDAAHKQILDKKYVKNLEACGITADRIKSYGFAFDGKNVLIG